VLLSGFVSGECNHAVHPPTRPMPTPGRRHMIKPKHVAILRLMSVFLSCSGNERLSYKIDLFLQKTQILMACINPWIHPSIESTYLISPSSKSSPSNIHLTNQYTPSLFLHRTHLSVHSPCPSLHLCMDVSVCRVDSSSLCAEGISALGISCSLFAASERDRCPSFYW
jgi:hypothetical protein